jgi:hypothetical protein
LTTERSPLGRSVPPGSVAALPPFDVAHQVGECPDVLIVLVRYLQRKPVFDAKIGTNAVTTV